MMGDIKYAIDVPDVDFDTLDVCLDDGVDLGSERWHARALCKEPIDCRQNHAVDIFNCRLDGDALLERNDGYEIVAILQ